MGPTHSRVVNSQNWKLIYPFEAARKGNPRKSDIIVYLGVSLVEGIPLRAWFPRELKGIHNCVWVKIKTPGFSPCFPFTRVPFIPIFDPHLQLETPPNSPRPLPPRPRRSPPRKWSSGASRSPSPRPREVRRAINRRFKGVDGVREDSKPSIPKSFNLRSQSTFKRVVVQMYGQMMEFDQSGQREGMNHKCRNSSKASSKVGLEGPPQAGTCKKHLPIEPQKEEKNKASCPKHTGIVRDTCVNMYCSREFRGATTSGTPRSGGGSSAVVSGSEVALHSEAPASIPTRR